MGTRDTGVAPKSCQVVVRLKPDEYLSVASAAESDGRSIAGYVRQLIRGSQVR